MNGENFYTSNNLEKYPDDGKLNLCKQCVTMHIDNWDPETYLWILQEIDVPYVPDEWNKLLAKYGQDRRKVTGLTIIGRYLSKMKLRQFKDYRWADTDYLQEVANKKIEEAMLRSGYGREAIDEAISKGYIAAPPPPPPVAEEQEEETTAATYQSPISQQVENELVADLTDEDRKYLCLKWGKTYRPEEWVRLEELYLQMTNSYDIQSAGDLNTLKLACKCSLKANQLLDLGDIDGAQKAGKMYDSFMKAGKWTAAQNKVEENELIDSIGELVALCERDGYIPRFYIDQPNDKADRVLQDMRQYTKTLVENETGLSAMVDRAMKQIEEEEERLKLAAEAGENADEEALFNYESLEAEYEDSDYAEFNELEEELEEEDAEYMLSLLEGKDD